MDNTITQIAVSTIMAIVLGLWIYLGKLKAKKEEFNIFKLVRTAIGGAILGVVAGFTGYNLTVSNWEVYLAANAGVIAFVDPGLKILFNIIGIKLPTDIDVLK